ncbi:hypothetical protein XHC_3490 [Xanthomonas hortorum pv. carotae str. M081]|nr:hypothetical protein XHC_3490 [Xanthomonas hortorum pv. carotae str. M081]
MAYRLMACWKNSDEVIALLAKGWRASVLPPCSANMRVYMQHAS